MIATMNVKQMASPGHKFNATSQCSYILISLYVNMKTDVPVKCSELSKKETCVPCAAFLCDKVPFGSYLSPYKNLCSQLNMDSCT